MLAPSGRGWVLTSCWECRLWTALTQGNQNDWSAEIVVCFWFLTIGQCNSLNYTNRIALRASVTWPINPSRDLASHPANVLGESKIRDNNDELGKQPRSTFGKTLERYRSYGNNTEDKWKPTKQKRRRRRDSNHDASWRKTLHGLA